MPETTEATTATTTNRSLDRRTVGLIAWWLRTRALAAEAAFAPPERAQAIRDMADEIEDLCDAVLVRTADGKVAFEIAPPEGTV